MKKSTLRPEMGKAKEVKYSSAPVPRIDESEFRRQIRYQMTSHPDYVDDRLPENYLHRCAEGESSY